MRTIALLPEPIERLRPGRNGAHHARTERLSGLPAILMPMVMIKFKATRIISICSPAASGPDVRSGKNVVALGARHCSRHDHLTNAARLGVAAVPCNGEGCETLAAVVP